MTEHDIKKEIVRQYLRKLQPPKPKPEPIRPPPKPTPEELDKLNGFGG